MHIVTNKTTRLLIVSKPISGSAAGVVTHEPVRLRPGSNEIDDLTAEHMTKSQTVAQWLKAGMIDFPQPSKKGGEGLDGFEIPAAITIVQDCYDVPTLDNWELSEKRKDVQKAIASRKREMEKILERN